MSNSTGRMYFQNCYTESSKPWFHNEKFTRDFIVTVNRARSDHYSLAASLARIGIINDPKCSWSRVRSRPRTYRMAMLAARKRT